MGGLIIWAIVGVSALGMVTALYYKVERSGYERCEGDFAERKRVEDGKRNKASQDYSEDVSKRTKERQQKIKEIRNSSDSTKEKLKKKNKAVLESL